MIAVVLLYDFCPGISISFSTLASPSCTAATVATFTPGNTIPPANALLLCYKNTRPSNHSGQWLVSTVVPE